MFKNASDNLALRKLSLKWIREDHANGEKTSEERRNQDNPSIPRKNNQRKCNHIIILE